MTTATPKPNAKLIMVIEDYKMEHRLYRTFLEGMGGYRTVFFDNAKEAIAFARSTRPDLIHLDVRMADYNGIEAARDLKGDPELADIPIVIVSATQWTFENFKIDGRTAPTADEILTKPILGKAYIEVLRRLIGTADSGNEAIVRADLRAFASGFFRR